MPGVLKRTSQPADRESATWEVVENRTRCRRLSTASSKEQARPPTGTGLSTGATAMHSEEGSEREREALEMGLAGLRQGLAWSPTGCPTWRAFSVLVPDLEFRLRAIGGLAEQPRPADEQTHRSA
jgi:hypothetical protein